MAGNPQLFYFILLLACGFILSGLAYQGWRRRHIAGAYAFMAMMISAAAWALFYGAEVANNSLAGMILAQRFKYFGITTLPVAWFAFSVLYSGRLPRIRPLHLGFLLIVPALTLVLVWTSDWHSLVFVNLEVVTTVGFPTLFPTFGVWWGINLLYSYGLILVGSYWMIRASVQSITVYQIHARIVLLSVAIPVLGSTLTLTNISPFQGIDLVPLLLTISALMLDRLLVQPMTMGAFPVSYHTIIDNLPEAVMVVDGNYLILSVNPPMLRLLRQEEAQVIGTSVQDLIPAVVDFSPNNRPGFRPAKKL